MIWRIRQSTARGWSGGKKKIAKWQPLELNRTMMETNPVGIFVEFNFQFLKFESRATAEPNGRRWRLICRFVSMCTMCQTIKFINHFYFHQAVVVPFKCIANELNSHNHNQRCCRRLNGSALRWKYLINISINKFFYKSRHRLRDWFNRFGHCCIAIHQIYIQKRVVAAGPTESQHNTSK